MQQINKKPKPLFYIFVLVFGSIVSFLISYTIYSYEMVLYELWMFISFSLLLFTVSLVLYFKRKINKVLADVQRIKVYLEELADKNYDATLQTKHFSEFLQIELLLKNIVKRLHKRDKKK